MQRLKKMNQEQLKELLQTELDADSPDRTVVLKILELLKDSDPVREIPTEAYESWGKFQRESPKPRKTAWKTWTGIGVAAAVLALILFAVPPVIGAENIFQLIGRWSDSVFSYGKQPNQTDTEFETNHEGLIQVYETVQDMGVTANVVPTWLPEGYKLDELITQDHPNGEILIASFSDGQYFVTYKAEIAIQSHTTEYQKDFTDVKKFEYSGITHYVVRNNNRWIAMWSTENVVCSITVDDYSILQMIITSIYGMEE